MPIVVAPRPRDHSPATHREQIGNLASLADAAEGNTARPPYPYSTLIRYAIAGSERGKMTLSDLYGKIEDRFPYFKAAGGGWKVWMLSLESRVMQLTSYRTIRIASVTICPLTRILSRSPVR